MADQFVPRRAESFSRAHMTPSPAGMRVTSSRRCVFGSFGLLDEMIGIHCRLVITAPAKDNATPRHVAVEVQR